MPDFIPLSALLLPRPASPLPAEAATDPPPRESPGAPDEPDFAGEREARIGSARVRALIADLRDRLPGDPAIGALLDSLVEVYG